jgi:hypothetical protein
MRETTFTELLAKTCTVKSLGLFGNSHLPTCPKSVVEQHRTTKLYGARSEKLANIDVQNAEYLDLLGILQPANYGAVTNYRDMPP